MSRTRLVCTVIALTSVLVLLLAACRGGGEDDRFVQNEQARIVCSEMCSTRGQCGTLTNGQRAVLANVNGPAVSLHDRLYIEGIAVTIVEPSPRELIAARDGAPLIGQATPFPHMFYRVNAEDKTAWVSEWCLERP